MNVRLYQYSQCAVKLSGSDMFFTDSLPDKGVVYNGLNSFNILSHFNYKHSIHDLSSQSLHWCNRPRNRSSRPLTIDPMQISINSIDRLDFWPFSRLGSTQRLGDRLGSMYLHRFLADRTNGGTYATVVLRPSPSVVSELWINNASYSKIKLLLDSL